MKLNYKRTICVGFAFFLICAFWQAYDTIIPLILTNKFGMPQSASGAIMALDNILALFMLPLFGSISDKCKSKRGRRTPFIVFGTVIAVCAFIALSFIDAAQLRQIQKVSVIDDPAALTELYGHTYDTDLQTPDGESYVLTEKFTEEEFLSISSVVTDESGNTSANPEYTSYVVPARNAYASDVTSAAPSVLILFIAVLLIALIAMATFRSPAVALMPDVTIKPLRSKANAVINLMGAAGGIIVLGLGIVFATGAAKNALMNYTLFFTVIGVLMLVALVIFLLTVNEPKFAKQMRDDSKTWNIDECTEENENVKRKLSKGELISLILILASVALWYMGYNAIISKYSVYATNILNLNYNTTLMIANAAAIVSYLPVGMIASKIGRKKTILAGIVMLAAAFGVASFLTSSSPSIIMNAMFVLAGIGWATINVNSFPMVVELASGGNIGKYTGFYYTASMAAQTLTPFLSGLLMDNAGMRTLFPYGAIFVALSFVTMLFVKHGDSKPVKVKLPEAD